MTDLDWLPDFIRETMTNWHVPGAVVNVIKDGETVFSQGFGHRDTDAETPITPETLFGVASTTKAFTTFALGLLVDSGDMAWDTPVRHYLPEFDLWDTYAARRITPRDLLCHRSGLPRHDAMWYRSPLSRAELVARLKYLEPTAELRTRWQYQNLMYTTAGYLIERITGETWESFVESRIFAPLGMTRSNFSVDALQADPNHALPYEEKDGDVYRIPFANIDALGPAGSINSCADDMTRWLTMHLIRAPQLLKPETHTELFKPQMLVDDPERNELLGEPFVTYGLGWFVQSYRGHQVIYHGGSIDGYSTRALLLPEINAGAFITCNLEATTLPGIVMYTLCDALLGREREDWHGKVKVLVDKAISAETQSREDSAAKRIADAPPSHPLDAYTGTYRHPAYETIRIDRDGDALTCTYNTRQCRVEHYHYDHFEAILENADATRLPLTFHTGRDGTVTQVTVPFQEGVADIVFERESDEDS